MSTRAVERRIVSVLFADLVGFTSLSERLDAEDVSIVQDAYFEAVRETVGRHGGELEKFVGDAAMAVFGAPRSADDDAERAVSAGLALVAAVERLSAEVGLGEGALQLRVGVNSGEAIYGEATAQRGPVTGDTVNVAARLQAAAQPGWVIVGEVTALAVGEAVELEPLGPLELKGKTEPVRAWRVAGFRPERSRAAVLAGLTAPTVGRAAELAQLLAGGPRLVVVVAPPGVGKTRLLDELETACVRDGTSVLRAQLRPDLLSPFAPIGQLIGSAGLADAPDRLRAAGLSEARAAVVLEALEAVLSPVAAPVDAAEEREVLFSAWLEGLDALAGARSAWLVEDLHWGSPDLRAFLSLAADRGTRLVVASARPALLEDAPEWCAVAELLHLAPLPPADVRELVRELVGQALPEELVERIAARSGGNALFVEELLRMWIGSGILTSGPAGAWSLAADPDEVGLPPTVQAIYGAQLDDLPPDVRRAARHASVAGRRFPLEALPLLAVPEPEAAVEALARRAFVGVPRDDPVLGPTLVFRHALLRDAAYASLSRGDRSSLHLDFADWLAARPPDVLPAVAEVAARHYAAALDAAPTLAQSIRGWSREEVAAAAGDWFERAAEVAAGVAAWDSARELAGRSLELVSENEGPIRARRLERLAQAVANTGGAAEAEPLAREALELYRAAGVREGIGTALRQVASLLDAQTRFGEAEQLADQLLSELGQREDAATVRLLIVRGDGALDGRDAYEDASRDAAAALALARALGDGDLELDAIQLVTIVQANRGEPVDWQELERVARAAGRWPTVSAAICNRAGALMDDEPEAVPMLAEAAAEIAAAHGLLEASLWCDHVLAEAAFCSGRWSDALENGLRAIGLAEEHGLSRLMYRMWFVLLPIAEARGREDLLRAAAPFFEPGASPLPTSLYAAMMVGSVRARLSATGLAPPFVLDVAATLPAFDLDHGGPSWLAAVESVVESWLAAGDLATAQTALHRMGLRLSRGRPSRLAAGVEALLRARLHEQRGDDATAEARRAVSLLTTQPWWRAKAIRALERSGAADANALLEAAAVEGSLGLQPL